ncbi:MAG: YihY/virulence factor BrkB family protein [Nitrospirae bacterium]|nr:YihY/virulence factor BrkB family protein [Nitrospirota bacterium]
MKYFRIIFKSFIDFIRDNGFMLAGSLAYFSMMALVPLCIFLITIFGYILGHYHGFYEFFSNRLISFFPEITSNITKELGNLIKFKGIGTISLILYGILSYQVFASLQNALNTIFKVKKKRKFIWSIIVSLTIVTLMILILIVSFMATSLIPLLRALKQLFPELKVGLITAFLIQYFIPFLMIFFNVCIIYIFFPKTKVKISNAFIGALFTTTLLEIAKHIFTWYIGTIAKFGTIYGPMTAFVVFLLWVFYSSCIFLIGAELVYNMANYKKT